MIKIIYVEYTPKHRYQIDRHLIPLIKRLFPLDAYSLTIVDTSGQCEPFDDPNVEVIRGENSSREFSGWQTAIDSYGVNDHDIFCLCNDTFARNYGREFLKWFDRDEVVDALAHQKLVGYADYRANEGQIFGYTFRQWVRTSIFFIRGRELKLILPLTLKQSDDEIFASSGPSLFTSNSALEESNRRFIEYWLTKTNPVPGESLEQWYLAEPLTESNRSFLQLKAKSILCELSLSAKAKAAGVKIFDVRRSHTRSFGAYFFLNRIGLLDGLQTLRRKLQRKRSR